MLPILKSKGWSYEYFHGPGGQGVAHASTQGLADDESTRDMSHVVKSITYGDLWGGGAHKGEKKNAHGPPSWLLTAYEGLAHFH